MASQNVQEMDNSTSEKRSMTDLMNYMDQNFSEASVPLRNGFIYLFIKNINKFNKNKKTNWSSIINNLKDLKIHFREPSRNLQRALQSTCDFIDDARSRKMLNNQWDTILTFLNDDFKFQPETVDVRVGFTSGASTSNVPEKPMLLGKIDIVPSVKSEEMIYLDNSGPGTRFPNNFCDTCLVFKDSLYQAKALIKKLRAKLRDLRLKNKSLMQLKNRRKSSANLWRLKYFEAKNQKVDPFLFPRVIKSLRISNAKLAQNKMSRKAKFETMITDFSTKLKASQLANNDLMDKNHYLTGLILDERNEVQEIETKVGGKYNPALRKSIYKALNSNVSVRGIETILPYFSQTVHGVSLLHVPHHTNIARMVHEQGVLALIQAGEMLYACDSATLCHDATTVIDKHLLAFNISFSPIQQALTISTVQLPGGTAFDYASHICYSLDEVVSTYAEYNKLPMNEVRCIFLSKIKSCLSDRAVVNNLVIKFLKEKLEIDILQVFCNVHPLDTIAREANKCLLGFDQRLDLKSSTGKNGTAVSLLYNLSKLRYTHKGCPGAFKAFLRDNDLMPGTFLRYVGNRIHVLFHMSGTVIRHLEILHKFLKSNENNDLTKSLLGLLKQDAVVLQMQALGLVGKIVTGPWMKLVYGNVTKKSNLEMNSRFKLALQTVELLEKQPKEMLVIVVDVFGEELEIDDVHTSLRSFKSDENLLCEMLSSIMKAVSQVMKRQMGNYLTGDLSNPTDEMIASTLSAPAHNMHTERTLGMADFHVRRAPNAKIGFLDAKIKATVNKTLEWVDKKSELEQNSLINYAMKRGAKIRKMIQNVDKRIDQEIMKRRTATLQKFEDKNRKKIEQEIRSLINNNSSSDHEIFNNIKNDQKLFLIKILKGENLIGDLFHHSWRREDQGKCIYLGRIQERKKKKDKFIVSYWEIEEEEAEDYDLPVESLIADMILGDLVFLF